MNHRFKCSEIGLFLNGEPPSFFLLQEEKQKFSYYKKIFAVDGAFYYLNKSGISVDYLIGDFDSIPIKKIRFKRKFFITYDQKYTDFDKALNIIHKKGFLNVNVWGASGKEQDHFIGNLSTALKYKKKLSIIFHDKYHSYFFSEKKTFFYQKKGKKISLLPFPEVTELYTNGLKYPIKNGFLKIGKNIGIRNESNGKKIEINYKKGELLIFVEK
ncbi:thiamine diphosphokinase [Blattabacterium cuenoti]|uniref:thiamine diphosphokinase n=1 Tax=Blattabacterium cuenoti TaxID=1653831 RepID=UPI00163B7778|nr:thiamine diphosphokinase [Blattabacterium cuenoti]